MLLTYNEYNHGNEDEVSEFLSETPLFRPQYSGTMDNGDYMNGKAKVTNVGDESCGALIEYALSINEGTYITLTSNMDLDLAKNENVEIAYYYSHWKT